MREDLAFVLRQLPSERAVGAATDRETPGHRSAILLHGRPEAVAVQRRDVDLALLLLARSDDRLPFGVHVPHQLLGFRLRVAEQFLEHPGHVGHQVDRVVPDDHDPGDVGFDDLFGSGPPDLDGGQTTAHGRGSSWLVPGTGADGVGGVRPRACRTPQRYSGGVRTRNTWNGLIHRGIEYSGAMPFRTTLTTASATRSTSRRTGDGTFTGGNHARHEDAVGRRVVVEGFAERDDRVLGRRVHRRSGRREPSGERRHVHDVPAAPRDHAREERTGPVHDREQVDPNDRVDLLLGEPRERATARDASIVDQHVGGAEGLFDHGREAADLLRVSDVARQRERSAAGPVDPLGERFQPVPSTRREHELRAPLREGHRRRLADHRRSAGDDDHLASKLQTTSLAYPDTQCLPTLSKPTSVVCRRSRKTTGPPAPSIGPTWNGRCWPAASPARPLTRSTTCAGTSRSSWITTPTRSSGSRASRRG